ncbi:MAG: hypothetical protein RJA81_523, partial [Planctomycetota bacterium]
MRSTNVLAAVAFIIGVSLARYMTGTFLTLKPPPPVPPAIQVIPETQLQSSQIRFPLSEA